MISTISVLDDETTTSLTSEKVPLHSFSRLLNLYKVVFIGFSRDHYFSRNTSCDLVTEYIYNAGSRLIDFVHLLCRHNKIQPFPKHAWELLRWQGLSREEAYVVYWLSSLGHEIAR